MEETIIEPHPTVITAQLSEEAEASQTGEELLAVAEEDFKEVGE